MKYSGDLVVAHPSGLYCPPGDFFIDPWRPVGRAVITHGHGDHARRGHVAYLANVQSARVLRTRLGADIDLQTLAYGETVMHNGVRVSLHPAGHVLGSAQVRIEYGGQVWVASGDYKLQQDGTCTPFEPVRCDVFITESTFALPIYRWPTQPELFADINAWWSRNAEAGQASVLFAYAFGKAQRLLHGVDAGIGPIVCHGAVEPLNDAYRAEGVALPPTVRVTDAAVTKDTLERALVVAPPSASGSLWMRRFWRLSRRLRQRLDAGARLAASARRRPGLRRQRSRRLAGSANRDRRDRRRAHHRHARQRAGDGALAQRSWLQRAKFQHGIWRRGRSRRSDSRCRSCGSETRRYERL